MLGVALDRLDQVGDEVMPAHRQFGVDVRPGFLAGLAEADEFVVHRHEDDDEQNDADANGDGHDGALLKAQAVIVCCA